MASQSYSTLQNQVYFAIWKKYRPVLLRLMMSAEVEPQQYRLYAHEFKALNPAEKGGYAFSLQAHQGKALNNIKTSTVAQDLLYVLNESKKASELMQNATYEFTMDKSCSLKVSKLPDVAQP